MDLILPAIALFLLTRKKKSNESDDAGSFTTVTPPNIEKPKEGEPVLKIDKVHKLLNRVDFTASDGRGYDREYKFKWNGKDAINEPLGTYRIQAISEPVADPKTGKMEKGPVMIVLRNPNGSMRHAKRVLVDQKKVIDVL